MGWAESGRPKTASLQTPHFLGLTQARAEFREGTVLGRESWEDFLEEVAENWF